MSAGERPIGRRKDIGPPFPLGTDRYQSAILRSHQWIPLGGSVQVRRGGEVIELKYPVKLMMSNGE